MTQENFLLQLLENNKDAVIIGSIGKISTQLSAIEHPNKILLKGAMGAALPFATAYALNTDKKVIVVIGEGAFLMRMGAMATTLKHNPKNLRVIILNNGCYDSCGGQKNYFDAVEKLIPFEVCEVHP